MVEEMTPRERVRLALNHKEPDRVPVTLGGSANHLTEQRFELLRDYFGVKDVPRRTLVGFYTTPDSRSLWMSGGCITGSLAGTMIWLALRWVKI